jgi:hypothetical protein
LSCPSKVLFVSLLDDPGPERAIVEFGRLGTHCEIAGAASSFAAGTRFSRRLHRLPDVGGPPLRAWLLARRLNSFVALSKCELIVPLDELAAGVLRDPRMLRRATPETLRVLTASLGAPEGFPGARSRRRLSALAADLGLRAPRTRPVADLAQARWAAAEFGYPLVVKRELTAGGGGVLLARDERQLAAGWTRSQLVARAKSGLGWIEGYRGEAVAHVAQEFVAGELAFRNSACRDGVETAGINFLAEDRDPQETAPSRFIRAVDNEEMERTARAVIGAFRLSGFVSFDFIVDLSGRAHLLELNPRVTGSHHLGRLFGVDLIAAQLGVPPRPFAAAPASVALFPKAIESDPADIRLEGEPGLVHDVPWDEPEIVDACLRWLANRNSAAAQRLASLRAEQRRAIVVPESHPAHQSAIHLDILPGNVPRAVGH